MRYSDTFKEAALRRLADLACPGLKPLAKELQVMPQTLRKWRDECTNFVNPNGEIMIKTPGRKRPQDWSAEEKYQAVFQCEALNQEERSEFCRRNGVFPDQLEFWKEQCLAAMRKGPKVDLEKKKMHQELKTLNQEIARKDKALAETAALLILKKKAALIFGETQD